jgi:dihydrofolate synthase / folylpolyglutamate synthase
MNFAQSLHYLDTLVNYEKFSDYNYGRAYKLSRIKRLLCLLGSPQRRFPAVTVVGTKGKGSTACMLGSILNAAGIKTGIFISPHLISVRERIRVGTRCISEKAFACGISKIKDIARTQGISRLTYFEAVVLAAFLYFLREKIEIAVLEAGLGGRLDAVNTAISPISVITPISYDHTHLLGNSLREIAKEKCGIIHDNSCVVSAKQPKEALDVIKDVTRKKNACLYILGKDITPGNVKTSLSGTDFSLKTRYNHYKRLHTPLIGA